MQSAPETGCRLVYTNRWRSGISSGENKPSLLLLHQLRTPFAARKPRPVR
jgi:hypothetical protein